MIEKQAWVYVEDEDYIGPYKLGVVKDGLGWVSEENLQEMAAYKPFKGTTRIFYFVEVDT